MEFMGIPAQAVNGAVFLLVILGIVLLTAMAIKNSPTYEEAAEEERREREPVAIDPIAHHPRGCRCVGHR